MRAQSYLAPVVVLVISLIMVHQGLAQEDQQAKAAAPTTPPVNTMATIAANAAIKDSQFKGRLVETLKLNMFEELDAETCAANKECSRIARLRCIVSACDLSGSKKPSSCFREQNPDIKLGDDVICKFLAPNSLESKKALLDANPGIEEADIVRSSSWIQAIKGNSATCQEGIKNLIGPYGKNWTKDWLIAMSGCRIISKERTREEEEADYTTWIDVNAGKKTCSEIINVEMFNACSASGAVAPLSSKAKP